MWVFARNGEHNAFQTPQTIRKLQAPAEEPYTPHTRSTPQEPAQPLECLEYRKSRRDTTTYYYYYLEYCSNSPFCPLLTP